jgi:hypothetical protein
VGDVVAVVLNGFDALHLLWDAGVMFQHLQQSFGAQLNVIGLLAEEDKEIFLARHQALQKSGHLS